jgi:hypothetical protein
VFSVFIRGSTPWSNRGRRIRHGKFGQAGVQCINEAASRLVTKPFPIPSGRVKLLTAENEVALHGPTNVFDDCSRVSSSPAAIEDDASKEDGTGSAAATAATPSGARLVTVGWTSSEFPD